MLHTDNNRRRVALVASFALSVAVGSASASFADNFAQKHPRRAQVLNRDGNLNRNINADKGHLNGHYGQLKREDQSIHRQEQRDARTDGGHITKGEQHQLNHEENHVRRQINRDSQ